MSGYESRFGENRLSRRRLLASTAGIAGGAFAAGCQTDIPADGARGTGSKGSDTVGKGAKVTLDQWYHQYGEKGVHEAVVRYASKFHKAHSKIGIEVGWQPGDYEGKLNTALLKRGPDVFEGHATVDRVQAGQIAPLDDLLTDELRKDFNPRVLERETVDGQLYAIPMVVDVGMIYYRKSMLAKAGVEPPETLDDLIAAAKKLTSGNTKGLFIGNDGGIGAMLQILPWSSGAAMLTDRAVAFDNEKTAAAYEKLVELNKSDSLLLGYTTNWYEGSAFIQGLCAMQWCGLWSMPIIQKELGDDFGVVSWPRMSQFDTGTPATFIGGWSELVNGKTKNMQQAKELVSWLWLEQEDIQTDFNLGYGFHVPPRTSSAQAAKPLQSGPAALAVEALDKYGQSTTPYWSGTMNTYLTNAVSNIVKKGANIESELGKAAEKCDSALQKMLK